MCNHRLDLSDAETITMRKFFSTNISKGKITGKNKLVVFMQLCFPDHQRDQFRGMVRSFCCGWNLVKTELLNFLLAW